MNLGGAIAANYRKLPFRQVGEQQGLVALKAAEGIPMLFDCSDPDSDSDEIMEKAFVLREALQAQIYPTSGEKFLRFSQREFIFYFFAPAVLM